MTDEVIKLLLVKIKVVIVIERFLSISLCHNPEINGFLYKGNVLLGFMRD